MQAIVHPATDPDLATVASAYLDSAALGAPRNLP
jgi:hypothetical protein